MAIINKPDEHIFATNAKQGEVDNFPDLLRGWGISFEQTGGIPPMEWFNALFKRADEKHGYLMQHGLPEWSATQDYPAGAFVQYQGLSYKSLKANKNKKPTEANSTDWQRWGFTLTEIAKASLTQQGIVQLDSSTNSNAEDKAATPKAVKTVKDQVDSVQRNQANYIPNSKKSSAVDSDSADTVATSKAAKIAYDKGVEAKAAAENAHSAANNAQHTANEGVSRANNAQSTADAAQRTANNGVSKANEANSNANGRVSKSGDTMTGLLSVPKIHLTENRTGESLKFGDDAWLGDVDMGNAVGVKGQQHPEQGYIAYGTAKKRFGYDGGKFVADAPLTVPDISSQGLWIERQHAFIRIKSSAHVSAAIDFSVQNGVHPHAAIETIDVGNYSTDIRFHTTPRGSDYNRDRRHHIVTFAPEGHIWAKPYGWLHDCFVRKSDIVVLTGEIRNKGVIPLPNGFTQAQCKWTVSPGKMNDVGGGDIHSFQCFVDGNRVVTITTEGWDAGNTANYLIIGVK